MADTEILAKLRTRLGLPPDATQAHVSAAIEAHVLRRAAVVGLSAAATMDQITAAEKAAAVTARARKVAASQMLGHPPEAAPQEAEIQPYYPPVGRVPQSTSKSIDWDAVMAEGE